MTTSALWDIAEADRATCSWPRFHPDEPCDGLVWGPKGSDAVRYCTTHDAAFRAMLDAPISSLGVKGFGGAKGVRKASGETGPGDPEAKRRHGEALAYVASYSGSWGLPLDIRADRRWGTKHMHLTERQVEVLLAGRDRDAARRIATEVAQDDWAASQYENRTAPVPVAPVAPRKPVVEDGMYRKDGVTYKVQTAVHGSGKRYAKRLDEQARTFIYAPGAIVDLSADDRMTVEDAEAFGRLYGFCCVCAATLTDEKSIARGIGPVCGKRV